MNCTETKRECQIIEPCGLPFVISEYCTQDFPSHSKRAYEDSVKEKEKEGDTTAQKTRV